MSTPYIGEIRIFGGNFAPVGWALCNGQLLAISQYDALFALIGTTYGGDGVTTFALPDLQCRVPLHFGTGPGLSSRILGQVGGSEQVTLTTGQMPAHTHPPLALGAPGSASTPSGNVWAGVSAGAIYNATDPAPTAAMNASAVLPVGGSQPHTNIQPFQCVNFIIALEGIFPTQG
jgi:microcystin-dependent protein